MIKLDWPKTSFFHFIKTYKSVEDKVRSAVNEGTLNVSEVELDDPQEESQFVAKYSAGEKTNESLIGAYFFKKYLMTVIVNRKSARITMPAFLSSSVM